VPAKRPAIQPEKGQSSAIHPSPCCPHNSAESARRSRPNLPIANPSTLPESRSTVRHRTTRPGRDRAGQKAAARSSAWTYRLRSRRTHSNQPLDSAPGLARSPEELPTTATATANARWRLRRLPRSGLVPECRESFINPSALDTAAALARSGPRPHAGRHRSTPAGIAANSHRVDPRSP
jgi:hypothetical protein